jgi:hypothetical protein
MGNTSTRDKLSTSTSSSEAVEHGAPQITVSNVPTYKLVKDSAVLLANKQHMKLQSIFSLARGNEVLEAFVLSTYLESTASTGIRNPLSQFAKFTDGKLVAHYLNKMDSKYFSQYINQCASVCSNETLALISKDKIERWANGTNVEMLINWETVRFLKRAVVENLIPYGTEQEPYGLLTRVVKYVNDELQSGGRLNTICANTEFVYATKYKLELAALQTNPCDLFLEIIEILMYSNRTFPVSIFANCHAKISHLLVKFYANATQMMEAELATKGDYIANLESQVKVLKGTSD